MPNITLSDLSNVLKTRVEAKVPVLINEKVALKDALTNIEKKGFTGSDKLELPFQNQLIESINHATEMEAFQTGRKPNFEKGELYLKKKQGRFYLSGESIDLTKGPDALVNGLKNAVSSFIKAATLDEEADLFGDGSGSIGQAASVAGQVVTMVDTPYFFRKGMVLDGYDASDNQDADGVTVSSVDPTNKTVTFIAGDDVSSVDANTLFYKEGSWVTTLDKAPNGLSNTINNSGSFLGLSRTTYPDMKAIVHDNSGVDRALTLALIDAVIDEIITGYAAEVPSHMVMNHKLRHKYWALVKGDTSPTVWMPKKTGFPSGLMYAYDDKPIKIIVAYKSTDNIIWFLNKKVLFRYWGQFGFIKRGGTMLLDLADYDAIQVKWRGWGNVASDGPGYLGRLGDITQ